MLPIGKQSSFFFFNLFVLVSIPVDRLGSCAHTVPFTSRLIIRHIKMREWPFDSYNDGNENEDKGLHSGEAWKHDR